jgi:hypothetical protein
LIHKASSNKSTTYPGGTQCENDVLEKMAFCKKKRLLHFFSFNCLALWFLSKYVGSMPAVTLKAHFNGKQIVLDEPFDLPPNSPLMVTVLPEEESRENAQWQRLAVGGLARAYGEDEPDYSAADVKR